MEIKLNEHQNKAIGKYLEAVNINKQNLSIAESMLNTYISGIASSAGKSGEFSYEVKDGVLIINQEEDETK